jgi:hypothetical protein
VHNSEHRFASVDDPRRSPPKMRCPNGPAV